MTKALNDNEPFPMIRIGLAAKLILNRLRVEPALRSADEEANEESGRQRQPGNEEKKISTQDDQYVRERMRQLAIFERRANGGAIKGR